MTIPWNFGVPTFSSPYVTSVVLAGKATLGKISASGWCDFCRNPAWNSSQFNWTKMKSGQSLVSAELIPYRSFTLLVVTLATMNLVIIEFGLGIKSSHFCTTRNATQRLAASTLGLRYIWIRSQILKRWLFNLKQVKTIETNKWFAKLVALGSIQTCGFSISCSPLRNICSAFTPALTLLHASPNTINQQPKKKFRAMIPKSGSGNVQPVHLDSKNHWNNAQQLNAAPPPKRKLLICLDVFFQETTL